MMYFSCVLIKKRDNHKKTGVLAKKSKQINFCKFVGTAAGRGAAGRGAAGRTPRVAGRGATGRGVAGRGAEEQTKQKQKAILNK